MSALTKNTYHKTAPRAGTRSFVIKDAVQIYAGELVGLDANGYLDKVTDASGLKFVGIALLDALGSTSATPPTEVRVNTEGETLENVAIAGTFVQADVNSLIYCSTSNPADSTKSSATNIKAIGWASRFRAAGYGDITLFTPEEHLAL